MPNLEAPGYTRYPGQVGLTRRDNAIARIRDARASRQQYLNACALLRSDYGYTLSEIAALCRGEVA